MFRLISAGISMLAAVSAATNKIQTLVVLDSWATIETHSVIMKYLEEKLGHQLTFSMSNANVKLKERGEWNFDNIVYMAASAKGNFFYIYTYRVIT